MAASRLTERASTLSEKSQTEIVASVVPGVANEFLSYQRYQPYYKDLQSIVSYKNKTCELDMTGLTDNDWQSIS